MIVVACSGPGAAAAIASAELLGWVLFGVSGAVVAGAVAVRAALGTPALSWGSAIGTVLVLLHPGWWWSARAGDCGMGREAGALAWSTVIAAWLLVAIGIAAVRRRRAS